MKKTLIVACTLASVPANAQQFPEIGARALGLAGAYVSLADGPTAAHWNPAGLAIQAPATSFTYGRTTTDPQELAGRLDDLGAARAGDDDILTRFSDAVRTVDLLGAIGAEPSPISGQEPAGFFHNGGVYGVSLYRLELVDATPVVDQTHVEFTDDPATGLAANTSTLQVRSLQMRDLLVSLSGSLGDPRLLVGASARWTRGETKLATTSLFAHDNFEASELFGDIDADGMTSNALSFDAGALVTPHPRVRFGVVAKYLGSPSFDTIEPNDPIKLEPLWRSGMTIFAGGGVTLSTDVDLTTAATQAAGESRRNFAAGAQVNLAEERVVLRAGFRDALSGPSSRLIAAGVGVAGKGMIVDLGIGYSPKSRSTAIAVEIGYRTGQKP